MKGGAVSGVSTVVKIRISMVAFTPKQMKMKKEKARVRSKRVPPILRASGVSASQKERSEKEGECGERLGMPRWSVAPRAPMIMVAMT
jgi:hypothetical protein